MWTVFLHPGRTGELSEWWMACAFVFQLLRHVRHQRCMTWFDDLSQLLTSVCAIIPEEENSKTPVTATNQPMENYHYNSITCYRSSGPNHMTLFMPQSHIAWKYPGNGLGDISINPVLSQVMREIFSVIEVLINGVNIPSWFIQVVLS